MTVQVEVSDLQQIAAAIDGAITSVEPDPAALVGALELVQTYLDNAAEETADDDAAEVSDSASDEDGASPESEDAVADEDIPF